MVNGLGNLRDDSELDLSDQWPDCHFVTKTLFRNIGIISVNM